VNSPGEREINNNKGKKGVQPRWPFTSNRTRKRGGRGNICRKPSFEVKRDPETLNHAGGGDRRARKGKPKTESRSQSVLPTVGKIE